MRQQIAGRAGFQNIVRRIKGEEIPFMSLTDDQGFVPKLKKLLSLKAN